MIDQPSQLRPLTAFRFLAALAVLLHHLGDYCDRDHLLAKLNRAVFAEGYSGVTFFFVLSGFILTYNYHAAFVEPSARKIWKFYVARFARIYPVHILTLVAMLPLCYGDFFAAAGPAAIRAFTQLTLTQSFIPYTEYYFSYNSPSWSLSNEFFFYALLPILLWSLAWLRLNGPIRSLVLTGAFLSVAFLLAWNWRDSAQCHWLCYVDPLYRIVDFAAGVTLGLAYLGISKRGKLGKSAATILECASLAGLGIAVYYARAIPVAVRLGSYYTPIMASIIFIFALQRGWLSALLSARAFWVLGEISFSFYMFHMVVLSYADYYTGPFHLDRLGPRTCMTLLFCVALAVSFLCHYTFERPMRDLLKRWLVRDSARPGRPVPAIEVPQFRQAA